jgi:hypothetical protein
MATDPDSASDADEIAPQAVTTPVEPATDASVDLSVEGVDTTYTPDREDVEPEPRKIAMDAASAVQSYSETKRA